MRKNRIVPLVALVFTFFAVIPAFAIIWGQPDGDAHPYVGVMVFDVEGLTYLCSGTLLSPRVFLTAGHCTDLAKASVARLWFDSAITDPAFPFGKGTSVRGTPYTHPDFVYSDPLSTRIDVGVVVLRKPVYLDTYGQLPEIADLDRLATNQLFTIVGYGLQAVIPSFTFDLGTRYQGTPKLVELTSAKTGGLYIHLSSNTGNPAPGGQCFGDSGGPALIGSSDVVGGVSSFVLNHNCVGSGFYFRVDSHQVQDWIRGFLD